MNIQKNYLIQPYKYFIQVTLLRKSWPLTLTQWQFVEQLKEQEKNELKGNRFQIIVFFNCETKLAFNRQSTPAKIDRSNSSSASKRVGSTNTNTSSTVGKGKQNSNKSSANSTGRPNSTGKGSAEKTIDTTKAHWTLRVVCDADKAVDRSEQKKKKINIFLFDRTN